MNFDRDAAMQKKWKAFVRKIDTKTKDYSTVLKIIRIFLQDAFTTAVENFEADHKNWSAAKCEWQ